MDTIAMQGEAVRLDKRATFEIADASGVHVACSEGALWLTLDHDTRDIILAPGESFITTEHRRALVYALQPSRFTLRAVSQRQEQTAPAWRERLVGAG